MKHIIFFLVVSVTLHANPLTFFGGSWQQYAKYDMPNDTNVSGASVVYDFNNPTNASVDEVMVQMLLTSATFGEQEAIAAFKIGSFTAQDFLIPDNQGILGDDVVLEAVGYKNGLLSDAPITAQAGENIKAEIWHRNYATALNNVFDHEDTPTPGIHGGFQFHSPLTSGSDDINSPREVLLAFNAWGFGGSDDSLIGLSLKMLPFTR